jgi:hypothetical protein
VADRHAEHLKGKDNASTKNRKNASECPQLMGSAGLGAERIYAGCASSCTLLNGVDGHTGVDTCA